MFLDICNEMTDVDSESFDSPWSSAGREGNSQRCSSATQTTEETSSDASGQLAFRDTNVRVNIQYVDTLSQRFIRSLAPKCHSSKKLSNTRLTVLLQHINHSLFNFMYEAVNLSKLLNKISICTYLVTTSVSISSMCKTLSATHCKQKHVRSSNKMSDRWSVLTWSLFQTWH